MSHTIFHTPSFTHHFVTRHLCHTIFHTQLCHTASFTTPSLSHHLSHTALSYSIFHHTIFVTHHLPPHYLSHTQLCHTSSFLHLLLCLSFLPRPRYIFEEVDLWGYPVLLFCRSFWRSNLISCERVGRHFCKSQLILPQFSAIEPHFVRKGCDRTREIAICYLTAFGDRTSFRAKGFAGTFANRNFWRSNLISCEKVATGTRKSQFYFSFWRSNFVSCESPEDRKSLKFRPPA